MAACAAMKAQFRRPITWMQRLAACSTPSVAFDTDRIVFTWRASSTTSLKNR
jgi:hypothetical protein